MSGHTLVHGQRHPDGIELLCACDKAFTGAPDEALAGFQQHMAEPALPSEEER